MLRLKVKVKGPFYYTFQGLRFLLGILLVIPAVCLVFLLVRAPFCSVELEESRLHTVQGSVSMSAFQKSHLVLHGRTAAELLEEILRRVPEPKPGEKY